MLNARSSDKFDTTTVDDILYRAASCHQTGLWQEAESLYRSILKEVPHQPDANHNLGVLAMQTGKNKVGLSYLKVALQLNPSNPQYWISYIKGLIQAQEYRAAQDMISEGYKHGLHGAAISSLESQLHAALAPSAANKAVKDAASEDPPQKAIKELLALSDNGQFERVEERARGMIKEFPQYGMAWKALGVALKMQKRGAEALEPMREAARLRPQDAESHKNLATVMREQGLYAEAEASCRQALALRPQFAEAYNSLGNILNEQGRFAEAESAFRQALTLKPIYAGAYLGLGNALKDRGCLREAENYYRQALEIDPNFFEALGNLTSVLNSEGRVDEGEAIYRRAFLLRPNDLTMRSNLLFGMNYSLNYTRQSLFLQALKYGKMAAERVTPFSSWNARLFPDRLRVGFVSGDLRKHPVGYFIENVLKEIDPRRLSLVAFATYAGSDEVTQRLRPHFDDWISLCDVDDARAAKCIYDQNIDILIDLSGHTEFNRLPVFAWRPAPVQISWLGYFATTGLAEMDYLLADRMGVPLEQKAFFSEKIVYLPESRLCFTPPAESPEISPLPAENTGNLTFASFQTLAKINDSVLALWGRVLAELPLARLRLQSEFLVDIGVRENLEKRLRAQGIAPCRVSMHSGVSREQYLAAHAEIDVILDSFPYPGGTTTCEALWMGVPTITLAGDTLLSRQGASLLSAAGLSDWITYTADQYVAKAVALSNALPDLARLRGGLRQHVAASPLFNAKRFAGFFEEALWEIGQKAAGNGGRELTEHTE